jgi:hypothetical protein
MTVKALLGVTLGFTLVGCTSPGLLRSHQGIEASLLKLTPLGSSPEAVLEVAKSKGWKDVHIDSKRGFTKHEGARIRDYPTIGVSSVEASLGDYWNFPIGSTNATAFWGFDKDRRLIEIWVWKTTDSL